jgi:deoxyadenosine/deoxycytidine kinase
MVMTISVGTFLMISLAPSHLPHLVMTFNAFCIVFFQQICHNRLQKRKRPEESEVERTYLESLHNRHEDWLINKTIK